MQMLNNKILVNRVYFLIMVVLVE